MSDDPTADSLGAVTSLSTIQLKPQPINNIDNNARVKLTTSPKSPKSNLTLSNNNSQSNNISNIDTNNEIVKSHTKNFAEATATNACPKLNQAIVFKAIDGVKQIDYLLAISKFTAPANITSASRISKNRFCIFFNNQNTANELVKNHQKILINNEEIIIRKLINPSKRITLSNVYPVIPDSSIIKALHEIGVRTTSAVFPLKTVSSSELFAHVTSFRRQIYINPEDHYKLPGSLVIKQEETSFHIFITDDTLTCFVCNQNGHISTSCRFNTESNLETNKTTQSDSNSPNTHSLYPPHRTIPIEIDINGSTQMEISTNQNNQVNLNEKANLPISQIEKPMDTNISAPINEEIVINNNYQDIPNSEVIKETYKCPAPTSTCPSSPSPPTSPSPTSHNIYSTPENSQIGKNKTKDNNKKPKLADKLKDSVSTKNLDSINEQLAPAEPLFAIDDKIPMSLTQFKYILENSSNKLINIQDLCKGSGTDIKKLSETIEIIRPSLVDRRIKTRLTKLANILFQIIPLDENQTDSPLSKSS
jgi:hypothetical protein